MADPPCLEPDGSTDILGRSSIESPHTKSTKLFDESLFLTQQAAQKALMLRDPDIYFDSQGIIRNRRGFRSKIIKRSPERLIRYSVGSQMMGIEDLLEQRCLEANGKEEGKMFLPNEGSLHHVPSRLHLAALLEQNQTKVEKEKEDEDKE